MTNARHAVLALAVAALLAACSAGAPTATEQPAEPSESASVASSSPVGSPSPSRTASSDPAPGAYLTWAEYDDDREARAASTVVLFFHASWCPDCQATEESLNAEGVPAGLTVVKVDFDTATDLRQTYGVTVQHTFVQVGENDDPVQKWTGSVSGADIADQLA